MPIRCLIVDDEPLAVEVIENYLNRLDDYRIVATCENALEAFTILERETIDLLFLDIQMPQLTGIEFLRSLKNPPKVIFTTAYVDYALEGYELDVLDYLVKPIAFDRFFKAINKYKEASRSISRPIASETETPKDFLFIRENKKNYKIHFQDILYVDSIKDYVRIHTQKKNYIAKTTLTDFENQLPPSTFLRVHRSYIVNLDKVTAHTAVDVEIDTIEIPIGISYKQQVINKLNS